MGTYAPMLMGEPLVGGFWWECVTRELPPFSSFFFFFFFFLTSGSLL